MPAPLSSRSSIDAQAIIRQVDEVLTFLLLGFVPYRDQPPPGLSVAALSCLSPEQHASLTPTRWRPMEKEDIARYTIFLTYKMKMLNKVLPDLKAIEYTDATDQSSRLSSEELVRRINSLTNAAAHTVLSAPSLSRVQ